jgi:undecaprenyl-diphosphatase
MADHLSLTRRALVVVAVASALVFVLCGVLATVSWPALRHLDALAPSDGHRWSMATTAVRVPAKVITTLGSPTAVDVVTVLAAGFLLLRKKIRLAIVVVVARLGELGTESLAKLVVGRPRPDMLPVLTSASGSSFPSGHAAGSAVVYGSLVLVAAVLWDRPPPWWVTSLVAAFVVLVAASRVVLGVHYPTDVLGGLALGAAWAAVALAVVPGALRSTAEPTTAPPET